MRKLLITGVPGTGKTSFGEYLATEHGFHHEDMEANKFQPMRDFEKDPEAFLGKLAGHDDVVVSWGFGPFNNEADIESIRESGYELFWFDGDRAASFRHFMEREGADQKMELAYYIQMQMIVATRVVERLQPTIINPFETSGEFRPYKDVAQEVFATLES